MKTNIKLIFACTLFAGIASLSAQTTKKSTSRQNTKTNVKRSSSRAAKNHVPDPNLQNPVIFSGAQNTPPNDPDLHAVTPQRPGLIQPITNSNPAIKTPPVKDYEQSTIAPPSESTKTDQWKFDNNTHPQIKSGGNNPSKSDINKTPNKAPNKK